VLLGEFGRAHGLRGEIRLKSFTRRPVAIAGYGPLRTEDGRRLVLTSVRPTGQSPDVLIARLEGAASRDDAEQLNGVRLFAQREQLGASESEDEFFAADLIGSCGRDSRRRAPGSRRRDCPTTAGGDLLEISAAGGGPTALLPFTKAFVPQVDLAGRRVVIDPPDDLFASHGPAEA
jgi:16S rRNA processing protein RimM